MNRPQQTKTTLKDKGLSVCIGHGTAAYAYQPLVRGENGFHCAYFLMATAESTGILTKESKSETYLVLEYEF